MTTRSRAGWKFDGLEIQFDMNEKQYKTR